MLLMVSNFVDAVDDFITFSFVVVDGQFSNDLSFE